MESHGKDVLPYLFFLLYQSRGGVFRSPLKENCNYISREKKLHNVSENEFFTVILGFLEVAGRKCLPLTP